jgi:hypothetical protein
MKRVLYFLQIEEYNDDAQQHTECNVTNKQKDRHKQLSS